MFTFFFFCLFLNLHSSFSNLLPCSKWQIDALGRTEGRWVKEEGRTLHSRQGPSNPDRLSKFLHIQRQACLFLHKIYWIRNSTVEADQCRVIPCAGVFESHYGKSQWPKVVLLPQSCFGFQPLQDLHIHYLLDLQPLVIFLRFTLHKQSLFSKFKQLPLASLLFHPVCSLTFMTSVFYSLGTCFHASVLLIPATYCYHLHWPLYVYAY